MKDYDSRRYHIGREGIPSRDHTQVKEKRVKRQPEVGFGQLKPQERIVSYKYFNIVFPYIYMGSNGDKSI
jgi:hypothetical protein